MSRMSFIGGFSAANYYEGTNTDINDATYTIGAIIGVGLGSSDDSEVIMSCLGTNAGYELRTSHGSERLILQGQAGVTTISQPEVPNLPVSGMNRVLFVVLVATADDQLLYINGQNVARSYASAVAVSASNFRIGVTPGGAFPGTNLLLNMCFYTNDTLIESEIQTMYRWLMAYGRLPVNGVLGAGWQIDHFWDIIDNRDAIQATWNSRGAVGSVTTKALTRNGTLSVASTGTAAWGW